MCKVFSFDLVRYHPPNTLFITTMSSPLENHDSFEMLVFNSVK